jgi:hypothetical protein
MHLLHISTTQHSSWLPKNQLYENYISHMLTLSQDLCMGHQSHGVKILQLQHVPPQLTWLCGHHVMDSLQLCQVLLGGALWQWIYWIQ